MEAQAYRMSTEEKATYKRLQRKVGESYIACCTWDQFGHGKLKAKAKINYANNKLREMQEFLSSLPGDFSNNRFMKMNPIVKPE